MHQESPIAWLPAFCSSNGKHGVTSWIHRLKSASRKLFTWQIRLGVSLVSFETTAQLLGEAFKTPQEMRDVRLPRQGGAKGTAVCSCMLQLNSSLVSLCALPIPMLHSASILSLERNLNNLIWFRLSNRFCLEKTFARSMWVSAVFAKQLEALSVWFRYQHYGCIQASIDLIRKIAKQDALHVKHRLVGIAWTS